MAKRETKETYKDTQIQRGITNQQYSDAQANSQAVQNQIANTAGIGRANLESQYGSLLDPNTSRPISYSPVSASTDYLQDVYKPISEFAITGGFTPGREASVMENVQGLKDIGRTGGLSAENIDRIRGKGGFDEFAVSGGYTPESIANIKAQALSPISSYATSARNEMGRRRAVQNGYAPGFDAANRQLQRDTARAIADTSLNANVGIQDRINAGRQWGIGGLAQAEGALAGLQSSNKLAGLTGAGNLELQLQNMISNYRAQGLSMQQATARAIDDLNSQATFFNAQNQLSTDQYNRSLEEARLSAGIGGLQGLYNTDVGQYQNERDRANALLGGQTQSNLNYLNNQSQLAVQPGIGGNIMGAVGAGIGGLTGFWNPFGSSSNIGGKQVNR